MQYYSPTTPTNIYNSEDVDERWDSIRYFPHQEQHLESKFQNLNVTKQVSPPLTGPIKELNTGCFKEDIQENSYFEPVAATPTEPRKYKRSNSIDKEDLTIMSVNDLSPLELIQFQKQESNVPVSFQAYHSELVQHYKHILIQLSHSPLFHSLPDTYKAFINNIKQNCFIALPCSL
ncbi:hypothetical protein BDF21DRAFT_405711 [Thamnidium elegans]|nr:hypothetical protein BDF21DRAFT_405711 [Thamnidium elegans]